MAKPQAWPGDTLEKANIIVSQNDMLVLSLVISHRHLKNDNLGMLAGLLPSMQEGVRDIYEAAVELGPYVEDRSSDKLPLWAKQVVKITNEYPAVMIRLSGLESSIKAQRVIEVRRVIADIFRVTARIQVQLIKITSARDAKETLLVQAFKLEQFTREIKKT